METKIGGYELLDYGASLIKNGQLVAFPTETVYGIGANAFDTSAVASIFVAKGRPQDNPLIVHISQASDMDKLAREVPDIAYQLMAEFAPGPLTLVLKKTASLPCQTTGGLDTVGVRIPNHPLALELIKKSNCYIAAPSANASGRVSPTSAMHVFEDMNGRIPLILDGGKTKIGIESTVLDLTKSTPTILRPGAITETMLSKVLDRVINHKGEVVLAEAPGMKYKHYAPICPCVGARQKEHAIFHYDSIMETGKNPVIIGSDDFINIQNKNTISIGSGSKEHMTSLFSALRDAEKVYDYIILQYFPDTKEYFAINNRIIKAIGNKII